MSGSRRASDATACVHAGVPELPPELGVNVPIAASSAFDYVADGQVRYPRYFNTLNHQAVAGRIAALESASAALVTSSGMGAISATLLTLMEPGDHAVLLEGLYGGTTDLAHGLLEPLGMSFSTWDGDPAALDGHVRPETRLVLLESPTNPLMRVVDLEAIAREAKRLELTSVADNTFASPILQKPLELGLDLVIHSGTKYLGGHSDLLCGAVAGGTDVVGRIRRTAARLGVALNAPDLALLDRSLKTLSIRVERQSATAARLAGRIRARSDVAEVFHPSLEGNPGHAVARRQMSDYGGMWSFRVTDDVDPENLLAGLRLIRPAVSLGGVETTICQPSRTSHALVDPGERARLGIDDRLMRVSTGIEDPTQLEEDLARALESARG